jgi:hypothetical protein
MAEIIRAKLRQPDASPGRRVSRQDPILKVAGVCRGRILSNDIDDALYGR